jgi:hypothetical protein
LGSTHRPRGRRARAGSPESDGWKTRSRMTGAAWNCQRSETAPYTSPAGSHAVSAFPLAAPDPQPLLFFRRDLLEPRPQVGGNRGLADLLIGQGSFQKLR